MKPICAVQPLPAPSTWQGPRSQRAFVSFSHPVGDIFCRMEKGFRHWCLSGTREDLDKGIGAQKLELDARAAVRLAEGGYLKQARRGIRALLAVGYRGKNQGDLLFHAAHIEFIYGKWPESLNYLNELVGSKPNDSRGLAMRGVVYSRLQQQERGFRDIQRALVIDPTDPWVLYAGGWLGQAEGALAAAHSAPENGVFQVTAHLHRCAEADRMKMPNPPMSTIVAKLSQSEAFAITFSAIGSCRPVKKELALERILARQLICEQAITADAEYWPAHLWRAASQAAMGFEAAALRTIEFAGAHLTDDWRVHDRISRALISNPAEALKSAYTAHLLGAPTSGFYAVSARSAVQRGQHQEASAAAQALRILNANSPQLEDLFRAIHAQSLSMSESAEVSEVERGPVKSWLSRLAEYFQ